MVNKEAVIKEYQVNGKDTGSSDVQVAILTKRINELIEHFRTHKKDHSSRRGLLMMVNRRRQLLEYVKRISNDRYQDLIKRLDLRK